jgi:L-alanine-DL-glutamate epimerase-like enolase superfamily enzyme
MKWSSDLSDGDSEAAVMKNELKKFCITRFQFKRDRVIGDSQVRFDSFHACALEITDGAGHTGLGFAHSMWDAMPSQVALEDAFASKLWPELDGQIPSSLIHRIERPRGGNQRDATYGFGEALQVALWDIAAQQAGLPLADYLGGTKRRQRTYASGLDFHMSDSEFAAFFKHAAELGFEAFKIKVGHADSQWDMHRLELLKRTVGSKAGVMVDANEAWSAKEAMTRLSMFQKAGHELIWAEDPILRSDIDGLKVLSAATPWTQINSGEYLDVAGRARLLMARATDIVNVHGRITEVMHTGWLAAELGIPVALGNTNLEVGVHAACALPEVPWLEYSFQNYDHLVEEPFKIVNSYIHVPDRPGLGLTLSNDARTIWSVPEPVKASEMRTGPVCRLLRDKVTKANAA